LNKEIIQYKNALFWGGIVVVLVRVLFVWLIPFGQTVQYKIQGLNDELAHYHYVTFLLEEKKLPVQKNHARMPGAFSRGDFEYHQPPLYYIAVAAISTVFSSENRLLIGRVVSFMFGIGCIVLIVIILLNLGCKPFVALVISFFWGVSFNFVYFCSVLSNDAMSWFFALLLCLFIIKLLKTSEFSYTRACLGGILLGTALLVKSSLVLFIPLFALYTAEVVVRKKHFGIFKSIGVLFGTAALISGWWYVRNYLVYGSLFALDVANGPPVHTLLDPAVLKKFVGSAIPSFWVPVTNIAPSLVRTILTSIALAVLLVLPCGFFISCCRRRIGRAQLYIVALLVLNVVAYIWYNFYWDNPDGRFLFVSIVPLSMVLFVPWVHWMAMRSRLWRLIAFCSIGVLSLLGYAYLLTAVPYTVRI